MLGAELVYLYLMSNLLFNTWEACLAGKTYRNVAAPSVAIIRRLHHPQTFQINYTSDLHLLTIGSKAKNSNKGKQQQWNDMANDDDLSISGWNSQPLQDESREWTLILKEISCDI